MKLIIILLSLLFLSNAEISFYTVRPDRCKIVSYHIENNILFDDYRLRIVNNNGIMPAILNIENIHISSDILITINGTRIEKIYHVKMKNMSSFSLCNDAPVSTDYMLELKKMPELFDQELINNELHNQKNNDTMIYVLYLTIILLLFSLLFIYYKYHKLKKLIKNITNLVNNSDK